MTRSVSVPLAVSIRIGTSDRRLISTQTSRPSPSGRLRSSTTRSGCTRSNSSSAEAAVLAPTASKPAASSERVNGCAIESSSSTRRILATGFSAAFIGRVYSRIWHRKAGFACLLTMALAEPWPTVSHTAVNESGSSKPKRGVDPRWQNAKAKGAVSVTLLALGGLAGVAITSNAGGSNSEPAAALKPKVRTEVIHRTIHRTKTANSAGSCHSARCRARTAPRPLRPMPRRRPPSPPRRLARRAVAAVERRLRWWRQTDPAAATKSDDSHEAEASYESEDSHESDDDHEAEDSHESEHEGGHDD